jgi:WD40 repeat protein
MNLDHHNEPVSAVAWHPDGKTFVTAALDINAPLCLWSLDGELLYAWKAGWRVQDCAISPDAQRLVAVSGENEIYVFDFVTKEKIYNKTVTAEKLTCINVSQDSAYILINRSDNEVQMLEIDTAAMVQRYIGQKQGRYVIRSIFGGAGENFVVSGSEGWSYSPEIPWMDPANIV